MGYAFEVDETVRAAVHRITDEQVERAIAALEQVSGTGRGPDLDEAVHDCRKRTKKLRGLIRLVRPALGAAFGPANESFRDAARELSGLRDAGAALVTFDALVAASPDLLPEGGLGAVRSGLAREAEATTATGDGNRDSDGKRDRDGNRDSDGNSHRHSDRHGPARFESAVALLRAGRRHVARAQLDADGWAALGPGAERTYRAGRRALADARRRPEPAAMHEWRKRTKDAWYHVRLLRPAAPSVLGPLEDRFHDLSDALGDVHDLVVITEHLRAAPDRFGGEAQVRAACELADARRAELERRAVSLGARHYAEKPGRYADRLGAYWRVWHESGAEETAGGLADLFPPSDGLDDLDLDALRDRAGEAALPAHPYPSKDRLVGELRAAGHVMGGTG